MLFDELRRNRNQCGRKENKSTEKVKWKGTETEIVHEKSEPSTMPPVKRRMSKVTPAFGLGRKIKAKVHKKVKADKQISFPKL